LPNINEVCHQNPIRNGGAGGTHRHYNRFHCIELHSPLNPTSPLLRRTFSRTHGGFCFVPDDQIIFGNKKKRSSKSNSSSSPFLLFLKTLLTFNKKDDDDVFELE
jgi:hypothetical protein